MKFKYLLPALAAALILAGALFAVVIDVRAAERVWMISLIITGAPVVYQTLRSALRGRFATDGVATLSILGSIWLDQPLAGLVIVLMQSGGEALERYAEGRASAAVRALEEAAPRFAHRIRGEVIEEILASEVAVGDLLLIRPGDLVPCDGVIVDGESELDTSSLTGEPVPRRATVGTEVMSGSLNGFGLLRLKSTAPAAKSQYARIVELVRTAQGSKAPLQRLADKYAVWFTPATIVVCGLVVLFTHDWMRALAVLVVATPCPLILATPVAIIGGINRAAKRHIIVRHGGALERVGKVDIAVFDKTGTITVGSPRLSAVRPAHGFTRDEVMRYAAGLDQASSHLLARVLTSTARAEGVQLPHAAEQVETPGQGVSGVIDGRRVRVGARAFVLPFCEDGVITAGYLEQAGATLRAYISVDDRLAGLIEFEDMVRPELPSVLAQLKRLGIKRIALLSGDHAPVARAVAERAGIHETYGDLLPEDKAQFIDRLRAEGTAVLMVGDGINDAPALTSADVGVALAAHGGGITAEAADVIVLVDSLAPVTDVLRIGSRTLRIAKQSIIAGLGLSAAFMIVAAFGGIPPAVGAALQELVDVAVIVNALRSAREPAGMDDGVHPLPSAEARPPIRTLPDDRPVHAA